MDKTWLWSSRSPQPMVDTEKVSSIILCSRLDKCFENKEWKRLVSRGKSGKA